MKISVETLEKILPAELSKVVKSDSGIVGAAIAAANRFEEWFRSSRTPFFKDYTDHSDNHSLEVFATAIEFIPEIAQSHLSAEDIGVLLMACYCHDCGMHLTESQFLKIIDENHKDIYNNFDIQDWPTLWAEYLQEARQFNQDKLMDVFGDTNPIPDIPLSTIDFTDRHRFLVGEFLRRYHPRLAHDIANGLDEKIGLAPLLEGVPGNIRDLVGFISRSHGSTLRDTFPYVIREFNIRDFNRIHVIYLMALLRLADYAQIQATRAPRLKMSIHPIRSPLSIREWRVHQSIVNITTTHDDPEALLVDSRPTEVGDYLRVKDWLTDLQAELDKSWAVLGEVYGRQTASGLSNLQFSIRRIRSNILDKTASVNFVPEKIYFKVSEPEMLSLLLAPLYGDHPGYGLRELIQNSRDAVIEAESTGAHHLKNEKGRVAVDVETTGSTARVRIKDNGVGMSLNVVTNYFLTAGASYRSSDSWKAQHTQDGKSKIARNGRFGVGALAAFLIGPKLVVTTRHWSEPTGLKFNCGLHDKEIQLDFVDCDFGTEVCIECSSDTAKKLLEMLSKIEDYIKIYDKVSIDVRYPELEKKSDDPNGDDQEEILGGFATQKFSNVIFGKNRTSKRRNNFVNGVAISSISDTYYRGGSESLYRSGDFFNQLSFDSIFYENLDNISRRTSFWVDVEDRDALAPLNLARTKFNDYDEEITSRIDDYLFEILKSHIDSRPDDLFQDKYRDFVIDDLIRSPRGAFVYKGLDFIPFDRDLIQEVGVKRIVNIGRNYAYEDNLVSEFPLEYFSMRGSADKSPTALRETLRHCSLMPTQGAYDYVVLIVDREVARLMRHPRWMMEIIESSEIVNHANAEKIIIEFGHRDQRTYDVFRGILEVSESNFISAFYSVKSDFGFDRFVRRRPDPGSFVSRWKKEYGSS